MAYAREELEQMAASVPFWWHSIDLGHGVVTHGYKSPEGLDHELKALHLPELASKSVLDIGAYDGFFSFEAERRGARRVVAMDHYVWALDLAKGIARWKDWQERGWWAPDEKALAGMCRAAGFSRVDTMVGSPLQPTANRSSIAKLKSSAAFALREFGLRKKLPEVIRFRAVVHAWK